MRSHLSIFSSICFSVTITDGLTTALIDDSICLFLKAPPPTPVEIQRMPNRQLFLTEEW